jgi:signal transduction histidine kinase
MVEADTFEKLPDASTRVGQRAGREEHLMSHSVFLPENPAPGQVATDKDLTVFCDRVQLQQVMLNLVLNAVEAVSEASVGPPEVRVRACRDGPDWAHVSVEDTGLGLSEADCERVLVPFFTTKEKGLGMGLSISRSIIATHGGSLWARPGADHGTTFHVRLPAVSGEQP